ncbi:putative glycoside hydrolase [Geodermatophilus sp. URMC 65]
MPTGVITSPRTRRLWRSVGAVLSAALVAIPSASTRDPAPNASACPQPSDAADDPAGRRGFWYAIGDRPTEQEIDAAATRYGVVVLNPWETWALERIKQQDPSVVVLVYKDLASTRSYHTDPLPPAGVGYGEADPSWFAVDDAGERIEWDPHPGHWQMAVWDPAYQQRWVDNVVAEVVSAGWDGVLADNDLATLRWYDAGLLAGTASAAETDARLQEGLDGLVTRAGQALRERGRLLVPNTSDARLQDGRWDAHAAFGGAMEENFAHWGTDPGAGFLWDWGRTGWVTQTGQLAGPGLTLSVTRAAPGDTRTLLYAYASVLVRGNGDEYWTPSTTAAGDYTQPEWLPEMAVATGPAAADALREPSGAWTRRFTTAWAAVNPTQATVTVVPPRGTVDRSGRTARSVTLQPTSGVVLRVECGR